VLLLLRLLSMEEMGILMQARRAADMDQGLLFLTPCCHRSSSSTCVRTQMVQRGAALLLLLLLLLLFLKFGLVL
jgi:hypothetical protein